LGNHIQGQLIRCSTSVAANYRAACIAHSEAVFTAKLSIVLEESDESDFWLEFIIHENLKSEKLVVPLINEARELTSIFISARKTAQKNS
jgi:four helix bundle protein